MGRDRRVGAAEGQTNFLHGRCIGRNARFLARATTTWRERRARIWTPHVPIHPFERLPPTRLPTACVMLMLVWAFLTIVMLVTVPSAHAAAVAALLGAGDPRAAAALVAAWPADVRTTATFLVRFDFLYDLAHNNAVALLCLWAARRRGGTAALAAAPAAAWMLWLRRR